MDQTNRAPAPLWFSIVSGLFLLWNAFGLLVFILSQTVYTTREALKGAGLNDEQVELTLATPAWVQVAFGLAVVFGVLGCLALLMKSRLSIPLLLISLIGVVAQNTYAWFLSDSIKVMGLGASPFVVAGSIALIPYAMYAAKNKWIDRLHPD